MGLGNLTPVAMPEALTLPQKFSTFSRRVSPETLSDFFDQLGRLLASGINLLQALEFTQRVIKQKKFKEALEGMVTEVRSGQPFSVALAAYPDLFDGVVIGMVKAAESSGQMEPILLELARAFGERAKMRNRLLQALAYPGLVAGMGSLTVCVLLVFVIPKLTTVFELWETPLPLLTRILLGVSRFMSRGGFLILTLGVVGFLFLLRSLDAERRRRLGYQVVAKIPILNQLFFLSDFTRLCRTWGMLLRSGVPLIQALQASRDVVWSPEMRVTLETLTERTLRGASLQESIHDAKWFPDLAQNLLMVGEATATLDESFERIASFYERDFDRKVSLIGTFLEPALILVIGTVVGFLVIGLLLPIFEVSLMAR